MKSLSKKKKYTYYIDTDNSVMIVTAGGEKQKPKGGQMGKKRDFTLGNGCRMQCADFFFFFWLHI